MGVDRAGRRPSVSTAPGRQAASKPAARPDTGAQSSAGWKAGAVARIKDATIAPSQISRALVDGLKKRQVMLANPSKAQRPAAVLPEDLSLKVRTMHMAVTAGDITGGELVPQMARIGKKEGFEVLVRTLPFWKAEQEKKFKALGLDNVRVISMETPSFEGGDFWTEDHGDLDAAGGVAVPAMLHQGRISGFTGQAEALGARVQRGWKDPHVVPVVGAVGMRDAQQSLVALAVATGRPLRVNLSHVEGGNQLTGTLPSGQRYGLVGKDSVAVTQVMLERETGKKVSVADAKRAIAADLGIDPKHVFDIEQPGDFHLDMAMSLMKPGQVLLNDAGRALELQTKWLQDDHAARRPEAKPGEAPEKFKKRQAEWNVAGKELGEQLSKLKKATAAKVGLEKLAEADLKAAGLEVVRAPAVFLDADFPQKQRMNFLNGEGGTNPQGKQFFITQGGDKRAQDAFKAVLEAHVGVDRVHFLDKELSRLTLGDMGGISCRARAEGSV
jgi:hypothetical protein